MYEWIGTASILIPAFPLAAAILTALIGPFMQRRPGNKIAIALPTIAALVASFLCSALLVKEIDTIQGSKETEGKAVAHVVNLWTWASVDGALEQEADDDGGSVVRNFTIDVALRADALTAMMLAMVTFISTLVAVYATGYMEGDRSYWRFFAYIGLFVFSMTMLVSVSNFVLLFVFWEAVGVCSYFLIGFWYEKPEAAAAGKKAFLVNRIGDFGFTLALFLIWTTYGTLNYHETALVDGRSVPVNAENRAELVEQNATFQDGVLANDPNKVVGGTVGLAICLLLLLGACGKSAQFPLHVWLPDAMEGPTPVSALIHAATMVTAGVYMVTRCTPLFMASPEAQLTVACVGAFTALLAGLIALTQFDLKRVLAYSTISQLGYMFLALGAGTMAGISSGMFHLFTHAFFKALLFLGAGSVMHAMGNIIDMRQFGGLKKLMPITFWTFLIGCLALGGVFPLAGFWSKDGVVAAVHEKVHVMEHELEHRHDAHAGEEAAFSPLAGLTDGQLESYAWVYEMLYFSAMLTALLTAFYTFRALFLTFFGKFEVPAAAGHHAHESPAMMTGPLVILAGCSAVVGFFFDRTFLPESLGPRHVFADFIARTPQLFGGALDATPQPGVFHLDAAGYSTLMAAIGILAAVYLYLGEDRQVAWLDNLMKFQWIPKLMDPESVAPILAGFGILSLWLTIQGTLSWPLGVAVFLIGCLLIGQVWKNRQRIDAFARRIGLGWLSSLFGYIVLLLTLILTAPLLLGAQLSPYRLSYDKFYIDELYDLLIVRPLQFVARASYAVDRWIVDGLVNLCGTAPRLFGTLMRSLQTGLVQFYALAMLLGLVLLFIAKALFWSGAS